MGHCILQCNVEVPNYIDKLFPNRIGSLSARTERSRWPDPIIDSVFFPDEIGMKMNLNPKSEAVELSSPYIDGA